MIGLLSRGRHKKNLRAERFFAMYDIVIIGGGPAGLSAAVYAGRSGMRTLILESISVGGQVNLTYEVDNYPGFYENPTGMDLAESMKKHAEKFNTDFSTETVKAIVDYDKEVKTVVTRKNSYETYAVIFASGANPRKLGAEGEDRFYGTGVSYCATCDGAFFKGQETVVVGGGNTAFEDALYLSRFCSHVTLVHRNERFRAAAALVKKAKSDPKITILTNRTVEIISGDTTVKNVTLKDSVSGQMENLDCSGIFIAVGRIPETELAGKYVNLTKEGFIQTDRQMQTNIRGVYAAGDVRDTPLRQIITAASDGAVAATSAVNYINELEG